MIIRQTTTIVFEYPQDYVQEQEWCKTKEDRWIHKGTDTLGAVYENQISYSIGATADRKTEPQTSCKTCRYGEVDEGYVRCAYYSKSTEQDEPQTEKPKIRKRNDKPFRAVWLDDDHNEIGTPQAERSE